MTRSIPLNGEKVKRNEKTSQRWLDGVDVWVAGLRDGFEENAGSSIAK
jgi:hypothetical protein